MEPRNFLPWILSAMVHSVIIYGLYGMHGALDLDAPGGGDGDGYDEEEVQTRSYYQTPDIHWDIAVVFQINAFAIIVMITMIFRSRAARSIVRLHSSRFPPASNRLGRLGRGHCHLNVIIVLLSS